MSVIEVPLCFICIGYHWVSSDLSRKAEKRPNCEIGSNIVQILCIDEGVMAGKGVAGEGTYFIVVIDK